MRIAVVTFVFWAAPLAMGAAPQLFSFPVEPGFEQAGVVPEGLPALEAAVGLYEYRERLSSTADPGLLNVRNQDQLTVSTGFFISPTLFLIPRHPASGTLPEANKVRIYTGEAGPARGRSARTHYTVKRILQSNARYGFTLLEIDGTHSSYLEVGTLPAGMTAVAKRAVALGYSLSGTRFLSARCELERASCDFCRNDEKWEIEPLVWGKSRCLTKSGMHGAPLAVAFPPGKWTVIGMLGPLLRGASSKDNWGQTYDESSVIRLSGVQARFGKDLSGRYRR